MTSIQLPRTIINKIMTQAQSSEEDEICGLISAKNETATQVYPVKNIAKEADHLFSMDPKEQINAMRDMRENNEQLFAIYHSHPHAPAVPSVIDVQQANYPDALYLIVSLDTEGVLEMRGFRLGENEVNTVDLELA
ncbi:MAG: M67 family metallopeptidase [Gammaproteobacteria bacterium]|nr:M67 family metallopeptidase [Gammaproteobacteria bacterium]